MRAAQETGEITQRELMASIREGGELRALSDCVYAVIQWPDCAPLLFPDALCKRR